MPNPKLRYALGIDLGGTKIEMGIVDETGKIHEQRRCSTHVQEGPAAIEEQILESVKILQQKNGNLLSGIGIGVAGQIQTHTGTVLFAPNLKWHNVPLKANIEKAVQLPTSIVNDVRAITLGEWLYGAGKGCQDVLCVFIGTGIGGGVVSEGRLLTGCSNTLGEVGHMTIDYNGPTCTCGKSGCFEAIAGGWGISARAQDAIEKDRRGSKSKCLLELAGGHIKDVNAKVVVDAYRKQDPMAEELLQIVQKALIAGLASLVNVYNPCRLILGGGFIDGIPEIIPIIDKGIKEIALKAATQSLEVVKGQLGKEVGVIGSAAAIFNLLNQQEAS